MFNSYLTHWGRDKMAAILADDPFQTHFLEWNSNNFD